MSMGVHSTREILNRGCHGDTRRQPQNTPKIVREINVGHTTSAWQPSAFGHGGS